MKNIYAKLVTILSLVIMLSVIITPNMIHVSAENIQETDVSVSAAKYDSKKAAKKISVTYKKLPDGVIAICKNKNAYDVKLEGTVKFVDAAGNVLEKKQDKIECLSAKRTAIMYFKAPVGADGNTIVYAKYKKSIKNSKPERKSYAAKIQTTSNLQATNFNLSAYNNSGKKLDMIRISCLIYDSNNNLSGYVQKYVTCYAKGSNVLETLSYPTYCTNHNKVKVYVDTAYKF